MDQRLKKLKKAEDLPSSLKKGERFLLRSSQLVNFADSFITSSIRFADDRDKDTDSSVSTDTLSFILNETSFAEETHNQLRSSNRDLQLVSNVINNKFVGSQDEVIESILFEYADNPRVSTRKASMAYRSTVQPSAPISISVSPTLPALFERIPPSSNLPAQELFYTEMPRKKKK